MLGAFDVLGVLGVLGAGNGGSVNTTVSAAVGTTVVGTAVVGTTVVGTTVALGSNWSGPAGGTAAGLAGADLDALGTDG